MARFFRKRKHAKGSNKNEEKVQRAEAQRHREQGGAETMFPSVKSFKLQVQFLSAQNQVLDEHTLDLDSGEASRFRLDCPGRCGKGKFDLWDIIAQAVQVRRPLSENVLPCREPAYPGSKELCGCQAQYRAEIDYHPEPEPEPES